jgi:hypothetical protein
MKRKRFMVEQIAFCLRQNDAGIAFDEIIRRTRISEHTFNCGRRLPGSRWPRCSGLGSLEEENAR